MCTIEPHDTVGMKIKKSIKQTWYGYTLIYIALVLTLILLARLFNWQL